MGPSMIVDGDGQPLFWDATNSKRFNGAVDDRRRRRSLRPLKRSRLPRFNGAVDDRRRRPHRSEYWYRL